MNFTREPIIETIITPKEGFKLLVRNSKASGQEEYHVEAIEVVSFGHSFFFRSLEKPKCFLVPVSDYEVVEVKETRVALKNVSIERAIKIGGGREAPMRSSSREQAPREPLPERAEAAEGEEGEVSGEESSAQPGQPGAPRTPDRRRERRRHRRRRGGDRVEGAPGAEVPEKTDQDHEDKESAQPEAAAQGGGMSDETQVSSSMFTTLFPPPTTLISETISRYKEKDFELSERGLLPKPVDEPQAEEEAPKEEKKKEDDEDDNSNNSSGSEGSHLSRIATIEVPLSFVNESSFNAFAPPFSGGDFR